MDYNIDILKMGFKCPFSGLEEKDGEIHAERHRRANRHKKTPNNAIPEWNSISEPPKAFFDGRFSEIVRITDGEKTGYAVFDEKETCWDVIGGEGTITKITGWRNVAWVKGY